MTILDVASKAVDGDRQRDYGDPSDNHRVTASLWDAYLTARMKATPEFHIFRLTHEDVCYLNILQKIARTVHGTTTLDTLADIAGYARNLEMMMEPGLPWRGRAALENLSEKPPEVSDAMFDGYSQEL